MPCLILFVGLGFYVVMIILSLSFALLSFSILFHESHVLYVFTHDFADKKIFLNRYVTIQLTGSWVYVLEH